MKAGLEIHQQLNTKKLFCSCPSELLDRDPDFKIKRTLRAVAGETGEIDVAASYEQKKRKYYIYEGYHTHTCLVELDEEPPHLMNEDALKVALTLAEFFEMYVPSVLQVMRKTVIDGSNTSGFQRTTLIGVNGKLKLSKKEITIPTLCLEEDAARKIEETEDYIVYRLDRLGIPLIEIATGPELNSPEEVKEAAEKIGLILRLTGKAKRGLGTIRQDINISIPEGNRVEIKGAQDLRLIPKVVELEAQRQKKLLEWKEVVLSRGIKEITTAITDLTDVFRNTSSKIIKRAISKGGKVYGIKLERMKGLIGFELQPNRRIGSELADVAKRHGLGGIFHSDELPNYGITEEEVERVKEALKCGDEDAFILVVGPEEKAVTVLEHIIDRLNSFLQGVPKDTRQVREDGTTSFLRPMPGSSRMYPETDHPLIYVSREEKDEEEYKIVIYRVSYGDKSFSLKLIRLNDVSIENVRKVKEKYPDAFILDFLDPEKHLQLLKSMGLSDKMASDILWSRRRELFEELTLKYPDIKPTLIFWMIEQIETEIEKKFGEYTPIEDIKVYEEILNLIYQGKIVKDAIPRILYEVSKGSTVREVIEKHNLWKISGEALEEEVRKVLEKVQERSKKTIKIVLDELRERADPKEIMQILNKYLQQS